MRKIVLMITVLFIVGCSNTLEEMNDDIDTEEGTKDTSDPLEFVDKKEDDVILIDGTNEYVIKDYYVNDKTDNQGFNVYEDGEFTLRYALVEIENIADVEIKADKEIRIIGEIINNSDDDYNLDESIVIKTDEKEVSKVQFGLNGAAQEKKKFNDRFPLEHDVPESLILTILDPLFTEKDDETMKESNKVYEAEFHKE